MAKPSIELLAESAPRQGFFERDEIDTLCSYLAPEIQPVVKFGFITGWRISEILGLTWDRVDFAGRGSVRLQRGTTKSGEARVFMLTVELRHLLETQWTEHERLAKAERISPYVFSRTALVKQPDGTWQKLEGQPIRSFIKAWRAACARAGFPGRIPHDLRRSAIRTFVRKGLSENTAMALSGHKTSSVFRRYDIVSAGDLDAAAEKLDAPDVQDAQDAARPAKIRSIRRA